MSVNTLFLDGDNKQLRDAIFKATPKAVEQCRTIAAKFKGKDDLQTCQNIWNFLKNEVTYVVDGEHQKIKLPSALLRERVGDCKSYSLFTAGILGNLGIPFKYALTSYTSDPTPAHIYVKTDSGIIIDAVWTAFNQEKKPSHIYYQKPNMKISYIAGLNAPVQKSRQNTAIGCSCDTKGVTGLGGMSCGSKSISGYPKGAYRKPLGTTNTNTFIGIGRTGLDWADAVGINHDFWDDFRYWGSKAANFIPRNLLEMMIKNNGGGIADFLYNAWLRTEPYYLPSQKKYDAERNAQIKLLNDLPKYNLLNKEFVFNDAEKKLLGASLVNQYVPTATALNLNTLNSKQQVQKIYTVKEALSASRYKLYLDFMAAYKVQKDAYNIEFSKFQKSLDEKYPEKSRVIQPATTKSKAKYRDLEIWWYNFGGSPDDLNDAVKEGYGKSPRGKDANYMLNKAYHGNLSVKDIGLIIRAFVSVFAGDKFAIGEDGTFVIGIGCVDFTTCTAVVSANIVPITESVLGIAELLRAFGIDMTDLSGAKANKIEQDKKAAQDKLDAAVAADKAEAKNAAAAAAAASAEAERLKNEQKDKTKKTNTTLIVGGVGIALVGAYFLLKK